MNIGFRASELASAYACMTLLKEYSQRGDTCFFTHYKVNYFSKKKCSELLEEHYFPDENADIHISTFSDRGSMLHPNEKSLEIDISILVNMQEDVPDAKKDHLRKKWGITRKRPTLAIGFLDTSYEQIKQIYQEVHEIADVITYDPVPDLNVPWRHVNGFGDLRELFSVSDAAMYGTNLKKNRY